MKVWIEKAIIKNLEHRKNSPYRLGEILWSPQKNKAGRDIYKEMRDLQVGDLVLHLVDNDGFVGISKVASSYEEDIFHLGTEWDGPVYKVELKDFIEFEQILGKKKVLCEDNKPKLDKLRQDYKVFYDKNLDLNQGAYITEVPNTLAKIIDETFFEEFNQHIPYLESFIDTIGPSYTTSTKKEFNMHHPLNTILYGPPGTGKTYSTILLAAKIIEEREIENYEEALQIFNEYLHDRIEFITFHQNFSYEDFIQGLRPDTRNDSELVFRKVDGVFKRIADRALENLINAEKEPNILEDEKRFEIALDEFINEIQNYGEDIFPINNAAYISEIEDDAFRFNGKNWKSRQNDVRMKFSDLKEFFIQDVKTRKDILQLTTVNGLAKQDATYFLEVYKKILKHLPPKDMNHVERVQKENFVIIIDEINRANISRVFGELITLIEPDKRSHGAIPMEVQLPSGDYFKVPSNLYIIGTMNTADKSIALLDIALRRRFEFEALYPRYDLKGLHAKETLRNINDQIVKSKGYDFQIGHGYFMGDNWDYKKQMNNKIIPLLLEYYMNDKKEVVGILKNAEVDIDDGKWPLTVK
jgi:5-methylcytosine-specific restriction protein B